MNRTAAHVALFAGLLLVSTAAPFIVLARMDAWAVVLLRMALAAPLLLAAGALSGGLRPPPGQAGRVAAGGALLALHFLLWVKAFDLTSYASNLLLLIAQPVIAVFLGARIGERPTRETWISLVLSLAGLAAIAWGDVSLGWRALLGDLCSVLAGLAITLFYVVSRHARAGMPIASFMGWTMAAGAASALPVVIVAGAPLHPIREPVTILGWTPSPWLWLAGLVLVTTVGGHGLMNLAARGVRLFTLNVVIVLEPAIAILLGVAFLGETVTATQILGGGVLAAAVVVALLPEWRVTVSSAPSPRRGSRAPR